MHLHICIILLNIYLFSDCRQLSTGLGPIVFHVGTKLKVSVMELAEDGNFDLSQYEHYWTKEESVPGLDFKKSWTNASLLDEVKKLLKDRPPLLPVDMIELDQGEAEVNGETGSQDKVRIMQWNTLAQGMCAVSGLDIKACLGQVSVVGASRNFILLVPRGVKFNNFVCIRGELRFF